MWKKYKNKKRPVFVSILPLHVRFGERIAHVWFADHLHNVSQYLFLVLHQLVERLSRRLWNQSDAVLDRVLVRAKAVVGRQGHLSVASHTILDLYSSRAPSLSLSSYLRDWRRILLDVDVQELRYSILSLVVEFGEFVAVIEEKLAIVDGDGLPDDQVPIGHKAARLQVAGSGGDGHPRALGGVDLGQLAPLEHEGKPVAARVGLVHLISKAPRLETRRFSNPASFQPRPLPLGFPLCHLRESSAAHRAGARHRAYFDRPRCRKSAKPIDNQNQ